MWHTTAQNGSIKLNMVEILCYFSISEHSSRIGSTCSRMGDSQSVRPSMVSRQLHRKTTRLHQRPNATRCHERSMCREVSASRDRNRLHGGAPVGSTPMILTLGRTALM